MGGRSLLFPFPGLKQICSRDLAGPCVVDLVVMRPWRGFSLFRSIMSACGRIVGLFGSSGQMQRLIALDTGWFESSFPRRVSSIGFEARGVFPVLAQKL
jgi:hypothetical protein